MEIVRLIGRSGVGREVFVKLINSVSVMRRPAKSERIRALSQDMGVMQAGDL